MFCPNCGTEIQKEASFCGNCGFKTEDLKIKDIKNTEDIAAAVDLDAAPAPETPVQQSFEFTTAKDDSPASQSGMMGFFGASESEPQPSIEFTPAQETPAAAEPAQTPVFQNTQPAVQQQTQNYNQNYNQNYDQPYNSYQDQQFQAIDDNNTLITVTKVFLIIGCIINGLAGFLIPLAWCLPMTIIIFKKFKTGQPIGMGLKICTLLFVSLISGVCMLCMKDNRR